MYQLNKENLLDIIKNVEGWISKNGLEGYDPYDLKATGIAVFITRQSRNSFIYSVLRELLFELFLVFPNLSRRLLGIKKSINPKAIALYSSGYLNLYKISGNEDYLIRSRELLGWLIEHKTVINGGYGWGYPFDWQSTHFIPANTPNGIVTTAVADACWEHYLCSGDKTYLDHCVSISRFLFFLPFDRIKGKGGCFAYTPLFINHVHNLNLFVAEHLYKTGKAINNAAYTSRALEALRYTMSSQRSDGAFDYNGPPEPPMNLIDHYHTGFVLRMLHSFWKMTGDQQLFEQLEKAYDFYLTSFFENSEIPKFSPRRKYRIDIHSSAESILCISELSKTFNIGSEVCSQVISWTIENMMNRKKTYFYHGIFKSKIFKIPYKSRIAYSRWGQAWMFKALTTYYLNSYAGQA